MAVLNRIVQISPEECDLWINVFSTTPLGIELSAQTIDRLGDEKVGDHTDGTYKAMWQIWPDASSKDECMLAQKAIMDKYPDTVAQIKEYIADNNITFEDTWWESVTPTEADQAWFKTFTE